MEQTQSAVPRARSEAAELIPPPFFLGTATSCPSPLARRADALIRAHGDLLEPAGALVAAPLAASPLARLEVLVRLIRVFPRRTRATPVDELSVVDREPGFFDEADRVHVSVSFTWDKARSEQLAERWRWVAPVEVGGVAYGDASLEFIPGRYIRDGYTITSRGCPRRCWFCGVWKKWPQVNLLPIHPGWNVLDDNLLACPRPHVEAVFAMLRGQRRRVEFSGGLEALSLEDYQVGLLADLKPKPVMFFAYDPGDELATLADAATRLLSAGFTRASHCLRCFVLVGYPKDTLSAADGRLKRMVELGFTPFAMRWRPERASEEKYAPGPEWTQFQRSWARPAAIHAPGRF